VSRYSNRYATRSEVNYAEAQHQHVRDLMAQVAALTKERDEAIAARDLIAAQTSRWSGLAMVYRHQLKHPGTSFEAAEAAVRLILGREAPKEIPDA
jgi:hypothetical protein